MSPLQKPSFSAELPNPPESNLLKNSVFSLFAVESLISFIMMLIVTKRGSLREEQWLHRFGLVSFFMQDFCNIFS